MSRIWFEEFQIRGILKSIQSKETHVKSASCTKKKKNNDNRSMESNVWSYSSVFDLAILHVRIRCIQTYILNTRYRMARK